MDRLFWFSLLLTHLPITESCLSQPDEVIWGNPGQSVVLPCTVTLPCLAEGLEYEWLSFIDNIPLRLNLSHSSPKYSLHGASLEITSLRAIDSGIYHCAVAMQGHPAPGTQHVGTGTTLVVREKYKNIAWYVLLWLSFVLLLIYSLAVMTLIVKKYGSRRTHKTDKKKSPKKTQFRDVLQEMYRKRTFEGRRQTVNRNHSSVEVERSADDIYQNV